MHNSVRNAEFPLPIQTIDLMPIHFVSGKGGVGKTSVSLALASHFSQQGRKTLFVQLGELNPSSDWLGFGVTETPALCPLGFEVVAWTGPTCLKEYAKWIIKSDRLVKLFFENRVSNSLIQIAPGLSELAILGKATSGYRKVGYPLDYDEIVIDAFATGHFLALFQAPISFSGLFKSGPMATQTNSMLQVLKNSEMSKYYFVTLSESLVLQETQELVENFSGMISLKPQIIVNQYIKHAENLNDSHFDQFLKLQFEQQDDCEAVFPGLKKIPWVSNLPKKQAIEKMKLGLNGI